MVASTWPAASCAARVRTARPTPISWCGDTWSTASLTELRVMDVYFLLTLHGDIVVSLGLDLDGPREVHEAMPITPVDAIVQRRWRDPGFRGRAPRAYADRCCVCGFDLRIGLTPAGLEAVHIQWHQVGGPDIETNGLSLCSLRRLSMTCPAAHGTAGEDHLPRPLLTPVQPSGRCVGERRRMRTQSPLKRQRLSGRAPPGGTCPVRISAHRGRHFRLIVDGISA